MGAGATGVVRTVAVAVLWVWVWALRLLGQGRTARSGRSGARWGQGGERRRWARGRTWPRRLSDWFAEHEESLRTGVVAEDLQRWSADGRAKTSAVEAGVR